MHQIIHLSPVGCFTPARGKIVQKKCEVSGVNGYCTSFIENQINKFLNKKMIGNILNHTSVDEKPIYCHFHTWAHI